MEYFNFQGLPLSVSYGQSKQDDVQRLFELALPHSKHYWRITGYFRSSVFQIIGEEVKKFSVNGGRIRLLTSVELTEEDQASIQTGLDKKDVFSAALDRAIEDHFRGPLENSELLERLVETGCLEIRISFTPSGRGIEHRKIGVFFEAKDMPESGDFITFSGSINDSLTAHDANKEDVVVFNSWEHRPFALDRLASFKTAWQDPAETLPFSEARLLNLIRTCTPKVQSERSPAPSGPPLNEQHSDCQASTKPDKWIHQSHALEAFLDPAKADGRGILCMATGSGKTRTAGKIAAELMEREQIEGIVVVTPNQLLLRQWHSEFLHHGLIQPIFSHFNDGQKQLRDAGAFLNSSGKTKLLLISNHYFKEFARVVSAKNASKLLVVLDETHRARGEKFRSEIGEGLQKFRYRLGLSATPFSDYSDDANAFLLRNVGPEFFSFGLEEAIEKEILCPLTYTPLEYTPSEEDRAKLVSINAQYSARRRGLDPKPKEVLYRLLSNVYKESLEKLPVFEEYLDRSGDDLTRTLIFVPTIEYGQAVCDIVMKHTDRFKTFFADDETKYLDRFVSGQLECLITCKKIAEGIDIPSVSRIILFYSDRARTDTTQRIGRALRIDPKNPNKRAQIVDFLRSDREGSVNESADQERHRWLSSLEMVR